MVTVRPLDRVARPCGDGCGSSRASAVRCRDRPQASRNSRRVGFTPDSKCRCDHERHAVGDAEVAGERDDQIVPVIGADLNAASEWRAEEHELFAQGVALGPQVLTESERDEMPVAVPCARP